MAPNPQTKTVTTAELEEGMNLGSSLQVINVLGVQHLALGMIRYSRRIPFDEFERRYKELDKNREIVVYCSGPGSRACRSAADFLTDKGYRASAYPGGLQEWLAAGLPMEKPSA
jgi:rhodanese-related sulfurtransferase